MRLVVADTGPVNYLIQIGHIDLLPRMFQRVVLPVAVQAELSNPLPPLYAGSPPLRNGLRSTTPPASLRFPAWMMEKPQLSRWRNPFAPMCC